MTINAAFRSVLDAALAGLALSVAIEQWMVPRPALARPWAAWALHAGLWLMAHAVLTLALARPWFAAAAVSAFMLTLVLVNNAKMRALREPFVFQDYAYFTDALRHPRLYIPFMGWGKFLAAAAGFVLAVALGLWVEAAPAKPLVWSGQLGAVAATFVGGVSLAWAGGRVKLAVDFKPESDVRALGLLAALTRYAAAAKTPPAAVSPFAAMAATASRATQHWPHLVAVQSESFFDPRPLYAGIRREILAEYDRLKSDALAHGGLQVPAWGANTVRTEFAFLTGMTEAHLGVHRFNPYRAIARGWDVASLASYLKRLGYRTVCIHPYPASFYQRDQVYPRLGFDEFLDVRDFAKAPRFGPYVADTAVAERVEVLLEQASGPLFVFVITMENHGPLHLERVAPGDVERLYSQPPPPGCDDLTIYLRHLANADRMLARLRWTLERLSRPASLCWYGDHVPIMPSVYATLGTPQGDVEYVLWQNRTSPCLGAANLAAGDLAAYWLRGLGLGGVDCVAPNAAHARSCRPA